MSLTLRQTVFLDGERRPDDYEVRYEDRTVGRILRLRSTGRELWQWTQIDLRAPTYGPNGAIADKLDEAKGAFRRAWDGYGALSTRAVAFPDPMKSLNSGWLARRRRNNNKPTVLNRRLADAGKWGAILMDDAEYWRLCAEQMRAVAEDMQTAECRSMALRVAEGYDRLAHQASGTGAAETDEAPAEFPQILLVRARRCIPH